MNRETMLQTGGELGSAWPVDLVREAVILGHLVATAQTRTPAARQLSPGVMRGSTVGWTVAAGSGARR